MSSSDATGIVCRKIRAEHIKNGDPNYFVYPSCQRVIYRFFISIFVLIPSQPSFDRHCYDTNFVFASVWLVIRI